MLPPLQLTFDNGVVATIGLPVLLIIAELLAVHPLASVTVIVYVPDARDLLVCPKAALLQL